MASYYEQFNNMIDMLEHCGASLGEDDRIITKVLEHHDIEPSTVNKSTEQSGAFPSSSSDSGMSYNTKRKCTNQGQRVVLWAGLPDGS